MNVLIVGAGTVGTYLAEALIGEGHSVVVIEADPVRAAAIAERLDVSVVAGSGTDHDLLGRSDVQKMDVAIAVTSIDEINLICALTCKRLGASRTIARVRNVDFLGEDRIDYREICDVDLLICPERLTAHEIAKFLKNPDAVELESFAHGRVQMRQIELEKPCEVLGKRLAEAGFPAGVLVAAIRRETQILIPGGDARLHLDDEITLLGLPEALAECEPLFGQTTPEAKNVAILGGGHVGEALARILEPREVKVLLVEHSEKRARRLSEQLPSTTVIHGDATQIDVLREERVGSCDVFVATTGEDEDNIMATQLAREMGVEQSIVLVHRPDYASVIQRMGFDHVLSPRVVTAKHVVSHLRDEHGQTAAVLGGGAELFEATVGAKAAVTRKPLRELKLPKGTLICMIEHDGDVRIAHGDDQIMPGDTVIAMALKRASKDLRAKLS